jgi:hypothetical protein
MNDFRTWMAYCGRSGYCELRDDDHSEQQEMRVREQPTEVVEMSVDMM